MGLVMGWCAAAMGQWWWAMAMALPVIALLLCAGCRRRAAACGSTRTRRAPPGSLGLPLLGESLQFIASYRSPLQPDAFIHRRRSRYGNIFTTHLFGKPTIVCLDPEINRLILHNDGRLFAPDYPTSLKELWGKWAILMIDGPLHKRVHCLVASLLKSHDFQGYLSRYIENCVQQSMDEWGHNALVHVEDVAKRISFNVTMKILLGLDAGVTTEALRIEFHKFINGVVSLPIKFPGTTFYKSLQARKRIVEAIKGIACEREKMRHTMVAKTNSLESTPSDLLGRLLEEKELQREPFPFELVTDNVVTFLFPAEDSVAMLMTLAVKYISECPKAFQQLKAENLELVEKSGGEKLTWRQYLSELPFTHNVLRETLRLGNIVKGVIRKALVDVPLKDFVIPKGWAVFPLFRGVHLDEHLFADAQTFNPWRWEEKISPVNYTPFGGGPRYCAGIDIARLEAVVFLHRFVTQFEWELVGKDTVTHFPFVKCARRLPIRVKRL